MNPDQASNSFWRLSSLALSLVFLYSAAFAIWLLVSALQSGAGVWDLWGVILLAVYVAPALIIPFFLFRAFRQKHCVRLGRVLPWVFRAISVSIILAICDSWWATAHTNTLFSKTTWATRDGGTRGYAGFGYSLTYYRSLGGRRGPEVWFWFTPFRLYWTTEEHGVSCLFSLGPKEPKYQGRTLSRWTSIWYRGYSGETFATEKEQRDAETAIRAMGTNCIPPLLALLSDPDPDLNQRSSVMTTFRILGPLAKPAAPALLKLTTSKDGELRYYASECLKAVEGERHD
jgi:hypothetical protein